MKRTIVQEEVRKMRFAEAYEGWNRGCLSQEEAARLLGMSGRSFRRYLARYEADGEAGLLDGRLENRSARGASADEVLALQERYRERYEGWNARHFFGHYQAGGLVERGKRKGTHRKKRDRKPLPGMMIHQDGSPHEWLPGQWHDLNRCHYVKAKVEVLRYPDGHMAVFHGPRKLAEYSAKGKEVSATNETGAAGKAA